MRVGFFISFRGSSTRPPLARAGRSKNPCLGRSAAVGGGYAVFRSACKYMSHPSAARVSAPASTGAYRRGRSSRCGRRGPVVPSARCRALLFQHNRGGRTGMALRFIRVGAARHGACDKKHCGTPHTIPAGGCVRVHVPPASVLVIDTDAACPLVEPLGVSTAPAHQGKQ